MLNQQYQEPFLAVVIDPTRTVSAGKVEIGAFRTYPEGYKPSDEPVSEYQTIPLNKIEDFGVHCKQVSWMFCNYFVLLVLTIVFLVYSITRWTWLILSRLLIVTCWIFFGISIGWILFRLLLCLGMVTMLLDKYQILVLFSFIIVTLFILFLKSNMFFLILLRSWKTGASWRSVVSFAFRSSHCTHSKKERGQWLTCFRLLYCLHEYDFLDFNSIRNSWSVRQ